MTTPTSRFPAGREQSELEELESATEKRMKRMKANWGQTSEERHGPAVPATRWIGCAHRIRVRECVLETQKLLIYKGNKR